jgi:hypothetical protein
MMASVRVSHMSTPERHDRDCGARRDILVAEGQPFEPDDYAFRSPKGMRFNRQRIGSAPVGKASALRDLASGLESDR